MKKICAILVLGAGVLSGCATTKDAIGDVSKTITGTMVEVKEVVNEVNERIEKVQNGIDNVQSGIKQIKEVMKD